MSPRLKGKILLVHRWIALALSPVILLVVLSGAVLAFLPILSRTGDPRSDGKVDAALLVATLDAVDPTGASRGVAVSEDGRTVELQGQGKAQGLGTFDVVTRQPVPAPPARFDVFDFARRVHRNLAVGAGLVVDATTYIMVALLLLGPFIAWPRRRNTVMGWHTGIGWFLLPLVALGPVTGVLLNLHVGSGPKGGGGPRGEGRGAPAAGAPGLTIARALSAGPRRNRSTCAGSAWRRGREIG